MDIFAIIGAAAAAWIFGAIWYGFLGARWMAASGLTEDSIDRKNAVPYVGSFVCALLVSTMFWHVLKTAEIVGIGESALTGLGLGLFVAAPWIATNVLFSQRDKNLIWMDCAYPAGGMTLMGIVHALI
ncbi:DUF1761 domain-containing protein [Pseudoruegeria sp. HB172150]|uniref:DUF1761 domain-containing protein n=1 Tax=Pseudoruegeria sp. HB172150 TaxID=2721164 RepID=UPI00155702A4|nr:DUF1761 domain-containing protein [Pseudoruegeria sp. HB172150]